MKHYPSLKSSLLSPPCPERSRRISSLLSPIFSLLLLSCAKPTPPLPAAGQSLQLTSPAFAANQLMPDRYGHDRGNITPPLNWTAPPLNAKSQALIVEDPDAPGPGPFVHWIVFNIPVNVTAIGENQVPQGAIQGKNDGGTDGYFGPKPPSGTHHYVFRIYALDTLLQLPAGASKTQVINAMNGHQIAMGEFTGLYSAK